MKSTYKFAIALATVATLGGAAMQGLHAQAKAPVYIVNEVDVTDEAGFKAYADKQAALIQKNGGKFIIRGGKVTAIDGTPPKRFTVYVFDSMEKMTSWQNDPTQKELRDARQGGKVPLFRC